MALRHCLLCCALSAASAGAGSTTHALLGVVAHRDAAVQPTVGDVRKHHANPLFNQSEPWEEDVNNGYPTVIYDPDEAESGAYRCFYDDHSRSVLLMANSSDGIGAVTSRTSADERGSAWSHTAFSTVRASPRTFQNVNCEPQALNLQKRRV